MWRGRWGLGGGGGGENEKLSGKSGDGQKQGDGGQSVLGTVQSVEEGVGGMAGGKAPSKGTSVTDQPKEP